MRTLHLLLVLLLVGWASCTCKEAAGKRYRSVDGCAINRMYQPLCGSDGCSYINYDALNCAKKLNPELKMSYKGTCREDVNPGYVEPRVVEEENDEQ